MNITSSGSARLPGELQDSAPSAADKFRQAILILETIPQLKASLPGNANICADPEESCRLVRAFSMIEDHELRLLTIKIVERLAQPYLSSNRP